MVSAGTTPRERRPAPSARRCGGRPYSARFHPCVSPIFPDGPPGAGRKAAAMSTWVECLDGFWANLAHIVTIGAHRHEQLWEVHLELPDEDSWFVHSRHESEAAARQTAERILAAAGERCLRQGI